jgi:hypothetical protein
MMIFFTTPSIQGYLTIPQELLIAKRFWEGIVEVVPMAVESAIGDLGPVPRMLCMFLVTQQAFRNFCSAILYMEGLPLGPYAGE